MFFYFLDFSAGLNPDPKNQTEFFLPRFRPQKMQTVVAVVAAGAALLAVEAADAALVAVVV